MIFAIVFGVIYTIFVVTLLIVEKYKKEMKKIQEKTDKDYAAHQQSMAEIIRRHTEFKKSQQNVSNQKPKCDHKWDYTPKETPQDIFTRKCKVCHAKQEFLVRGSGSPTWG